MKAVWYERTGPAAEVLTYGEIAIPVPAANEVRIALKASGVNPADVNRRRGAGYAIDAPFIVPNSDGAGIVDAVGADVQQEWIGQRVWLYNGQRGRNLGTAAEFIAIDADLVARLPDNVSFKVGACLGIPCMTAHVCVHARGDIAGKTLLVTGGAGAVGNYAIQLAKWAGARVIATVSASGAADARTAGADIVIDRQKDNVPVVIGEATAGKGVDHIVDVDFGGNLLMLPDIVALNGTIASYASRGDATPKFPFYPLMRRNIGIRLVLLPTAPHDARKKAQTDIVRWLDEAPRFHRVAAVFPLSETAAAHEAVEAGGRRGTVVVAI